MGLYLAQEICHRLGHEMKITSNVGEGTTVSIIFEQQETTERGELDVDIDVGRNNEGL